MDKFYKHSVKRKKPDVKKYLLYNSIYMMFENRQN